MADFQHLSLIDGHPADGRLLEPSQGSKLLWGEMALEWIGGWVGGEFEGIDHDLSLAVTPEYSTPNRLVWDPTLGIGPVISARVY
jgi:hypothetical protein